MRAVLRMVLVGVGAFGLAGVSGLPWLATGSARASVSASTSPSAYAARTRSGDLAPVCRGRGARRAPRPNGASTAASTNAGAGARVAVQPFEGPSGAELRALIARVVRARGFRPVTNLPHFEGTGQYPAVAHDRHLAAFVTADIEEHGSRESITFLVWNGLTGAVLARWTAGAPTASLARVVEKRFWSHLGPAMLKAQPPPAPAQARAPTVRIDASHADDDDDPVAEQE